MKNFFENLLDKLVIKRHYLIIEESNVLDVLSAIDKTSKWFISSNLDVGNCEWLIDPTKWFVHFNASNDQWWSIVPELTKKFDLVITDGSDDVFVVKKKIES